MNCIGWRDLGLLYYRKIEQIFIFLLQETHGHDLSVKGSRIARENGETENNELHRFKVCYTTA